MTPLPLGAHNISTLHFCRIYGVVQNEHNLKREQENRKFLNFQLQKIDSKRTQFWIWINLFSISESSDKKFCWRSIAPWVLKTFPHPVWLIGENQANFCSLWLKMAISSQTEIIYSFDSSVTFLDHSSLNFLNAALSSTVHNFFFNKTAGYLQQTFCASSFLLKKAFKKRKTIFSRKSTFSSSYFLIFITLKNFLFSKKTHN